MKKIEKLSDVFTNRKEIEKQVDGIFEFLKMVHPTAAEERFHHPIEIRFLHRNEEGTKGLHSCNLFGLNEKSKLHLISKIEEYADKSICMYYSAFKYDQSYECELKRTARNGRKYTIIGKPQKIQKASALGTQELAMDFDNINYEEFTVYKNILNSLGIEFVIVFSGHGFQSHILLDRYYEDPTLFEVFTGKLKKLGFNIDTVIVDPSRVLRLPYTVNFKEFDRQKNKIGSPVAVETSIIESTEKRYSVDFVFAKLDELIEKRNQLLEEEQDNMIDDFISIVAPEWNEDNSGTSTAVVDEKAEKKASKPKKEETKQKEKKKTEHTVKTEKYFAELYKHIKFEKLKSQIKAILMGVDEGVRNDALLFLLPFLRNELGLTLNQATETLKIWGENCSPRYLPDFVALEVERLWEYNNKATYGKYTNGLEEIYGKLDIIHAVVSDRQIAIENRLFRVIDKLEGPALKIYLTMKMMEKEENKKEFTKEEIAERAEITIRTVTNGMQSLVLTKLINKKKSVKKQDGEKVTFSINTLGTDKYGFTKIETATVELMIIKKLSKYEFAFYVFMCAKTWSSTESILFMSRESIAEAIGSSSETTISKITDKLAKLKFIRKETDKMGKTLICKYTLLK